MSTVRRFSTCAKHRYPRSPKQDNKAESPWLR